MDKFSEAADWNPERHMGAIDHDTVCTESEHIFNNMDKGVVYNREDTNWSVKSTVYTE
jgi:hypothetical protein